MQLKDIQHGNDPVSELQFKAVKESLLAAYELGVLGNPFPEDLLEELVHQLIKVVKI